MATTPPKQNPNSGDPSEAVNSAAASAPAAPVRIWTSLFAGPPPSKDTRLLAAVSDHHRRLFRGRRSRLPTLPLPIYRPPIQDTDEMAIARAILEDIVHHTLSSLHTIQETLLYWQSRAEETRLQRMYFMACQRGPRAFVEAACGMLSRLRSNTSPFPYLLNSANCMLTTKRARLKSMKRCLAAFLAEVYSEVSEHMEGSPESSDKSLHTLFILLNRAFPKLEASLRNASEGEAALFTHDGNSSELLFERLPEVDVESSQWTEALSTDAIGLIYQNLKKLDSFVSSQFSGLQKPSNLTVYWIPYTCGAIGLSACSVWLLRHSNLMGSSDMNNWTQCGKELVARFRDKHVEKPIIPLKELFQTFKRTDELAMEQEIQQTDRSLRRMLFAFCEKNSLEKLPQDVSTQVLVGTATKRYVEESIHPIQNEFSEGLANVMLLKDRRGRIARHERKLLLIGIDQMLMKSRKCMVNGMEKEASCNFGLILYNLDSLYKGVESDARRTGEWSSVREDIVVLTKPHLGMEDQLFALSRLQDMYACIFQSPCPGSAYHQLQLLRSESDDIQT
ncbi:protein DGS1, mitochondrial-like [Lolium rigidum]|uniref:protein DGS1, mitochondrial-like n=1 Tax=Lolium rigidum TaxID=89674 RepID=UPI001F5C97FC|nr:protein DGS1, mitochondrial-like [Lolium rigidum]